jgi:hypothetical protein
MTRGGEFAKGLEAGCRAAMDLYERLLHDEDFVPAFAPELDIVVWAVKGETVEQSSGRAQAVFDEASVRRLHLALAALPVRFFPAGTWPGAAPTAVVRCLRSVLMKPEHAAWMPEIYRLLLEAKESVLRDESSAHEGVTP